MLCRMTWAVLLVAIGFSTASLAQAESQCQNVDMNNLVHTANYAGIHIGNGGDVVVKRDPAGAIVAAKLLDYYESETQRRPPIVHELGDANLPLRAKLDMALSRLARLDALRADRLRGWLDTFFSDACFMSGIRLEDIPDSQHVQLPQEPGWAIEQIAVQREPMFPEDARYVVNKDLWDVLDNDNKAGLLLHEVLYRDAISFDIENSIGVRYLIATFTSHLGDSWDISTYLDRLLTIGIGTASMQGIWLDIKAMRPVLYPNGKIEVAEVVKDTPVKTKWGLFKLRCRISGLEDGTINGFSLSQYTDGSAGVVVKGKLYRFSHRGSFTQTCDELPPLPIGNGMPYDFFINKPDAPDDAVIYMNTDTTTEFAGPNYAVAIGEFHLFERGKISDAMNSPNWARSFDPYIELYGTKCPLDAGLISFGANQEDREGELDRLVPYGAVLGYCFVKMGANELQLKGNAYFRHENNSFQLGEATLLSSQRLKITTSSDSLSVLFSNEDFVSFFRSGNIRSGRIAEAVNLKFENGQYQIVPANSFISFNEDGSVRDFDPRASGGGH